MCGLGVQWLLGRSYKTHAIPCTQASSVIIAVAQGTKWEAPRQGCIRPTRQDLPVYRSNHPPMNG